MRRFLNLSVLIWKACLLIGFISTQSYFVSAQPNPTNTIYGNGAGANLLGSRNSFFGFETGANNYNAFDSSYFGTEAGKNSSGQLNSFFGSKAGLNQNDGASNASFGAMAGQDSKGNGNSFFGTQAGSSQIRGDFNTLIGVNTQILTPNISYSTAIGANATVSQSNSLVLGAISTKVGIGTTAPAFKLDVFDRIRIRQNPADQGPNNTAGLWLTQTNTSAVNAFIGMKSDTSVGFYGIGGGWGLSMDTLTGITTLNVVGGGGVQALCRNALNQIAGCSSSIRYKSNVSSFTSGLDLIKRLRPVSFNWTQNNQFDFGLVAEEVAEVEPLLATYNDKGKVEGVKYDRVGVVLINAVNEQQSQIEAHQKQINQQNEIIKRQQTELEALKKLVCLQNPAAKLCF